MAPSTLARDGRRCGGYWRRSGQTAVESMLQEAREERNMLTVFAEAWGSSRCSRGVKGRTEFTAIAHRSSCWRRLRVVVVEVELTGHPRMNVWHRRMRQDAVSVFACRGRREAAGCGRNREGGSSETERLGEKLERPGGELGEGDRGKRRRRGVLLSVRGHRRS